MPVVPAPVGVLVSAGMVSKARVNSESCMATAGCMASACTTRKKTAADTRNDVRVVLQTSGCLQNVLDKLIT